MKFTHQVLFRGIDMPPKLVSDDEAAAIREAKETGRNKTISLGDDTFETKDVKRLVRLDTAVNRNSSYDCPNEQCHKPNRRHLAGEVCDYSYTANCEVCGTPIWERDREYAVYKLKKILCAAHCGMPIFSNKTSGVGK